MSELDQINSSTDLQLAIKSQIGTLNQIHDHEPYDDHEWDLIRKYMFTMVRIARESWKNSETPTGTLNVSDNINIALSYTPLENGVDRSLTLTINGEIVGIGNCASIFRLVERSDTSYPDFQLVESESRVGLKRLLVEMGKALSLRI